MGRPIPRRSAPTNPATIPRKPPVPADPPRPAPASRAARRSSMNGRACSRARWSRHGRRCSSSGPDSAPGRTPPNWGRADALPTTAGPSPTAARRDAEGGGGPIGTGMNGNACLEASEARPHAVWRHRPERAIRQPPQPDCRFAPSCPSKPHDFRGARLARRGERSAATGGSSHTLAAGESLRHSDWRHADCAHPGQGLPARQRSPGRSPR